MKFLKYIALCIVMAACAKNNSTTEDSTAAPALPEPSSAGQQAEIIEDIAQNALRQVDKKYVPKQITNAEWTEATESERVFDEYTSPMKIEVMHQEECYNSLSINCFGKSDNSYLVLLITEGGCDGGASILAKTFNFKDCTLTETENPIEYPKFDEYLNGTKVPQELQNDIEYLKNEYKSNKDLSGLDFRFDKDRNLEIRPGGIYDEETWNIIKPVRYGFDGETLRKLND